MSPYPNRPPEGAETGLFELKKECIALYNAYYYHLDAKDRATAEVYIAAQVCIYALTS